ncbi:PKD domain-containing protein [Desulfobulbus propionicus]
MQRKIIRLLTYLFCGLAIAVSAAAQSIHVEWGYTPPTEPAVTGFKLYQEGISVCQTQNPNATAMDCEVTLTATTTNFTLTATFGDGTESPHSAPFAFTSGDSSSSDDSSDTGSGDTGTTDDTTAKTPVSGTTGNKLFTFSWEQPTDLSNIAGYRVYLNSTRLCETVTPTDTSIACTANLLPGEMVFSMSQVYTDGSESGLSNLLVFDPTTYPETFTFKLLNFSWDYTGDASAITGFRIYQNNLPICETTDPAARDLACTVDVPSGSLVYGVKALNTDGTETSLSNLLAYAPDTSSTPTEETATLQAVIQATPLTGTAPVTVQFSAASSTGSISQYQWDFGDGSVAESSTVSHEYTSAGTYTAKLTVTTSSGSSSTATVSVIATEPAVASTPPTAVVSSSSAAGPAPLSVSFDATGSSASGSATITGYSWSFGDGTSATGASATHSFTSAGTYSTVLTVTDSNGLTSSASTPVVVTAAAENVAPKAVISATPTSGSAPLTVTFDGSASSDSDGTIASYTWHFGDGSSASGKTVSHTYTTEASFAATLQVTDDLGATATTSTTITVKPEETAASLNIETGEVAVTGDWVRVSLSSTFQNPVVIAGPAGFNNSDPGVIRLRNVDATGFDIKFSEWNYLDGAHPEETVSYMVVEKGRYTLPDGSMVEAGSFAGTTKWTTVAFSAVFAKTPVVMTTIASNNETDTISGRLKDIATTGFAYYFREQELNTNKHVNETVHYLAWEPGEGSLGTMQYRVAATDKAVTQVWSATTFPSPYATPPLLLADMQTTAGADASALRTQKLSATGFEVKVEEEQSKDSEVGHVAETVGYIALSQKEEKVLATFTWEFDQVQESTISGFQILANGEVVCTSDKPTDRQLSCEITLPTSPTAFTIQAVDASGATSNPSNSLSYTP